MFIQRPWLAYTFDGGPSSTNLFTDIADGEQPLLLSGRNGAEENTLDVSGGAYGRVQGNPWTGDAMTITFRAKFDSLNPWSRVFDFGDGPDTNNILFGNVGTTNDATFRIVKNGVTYAMTMPDAIEVGVEQIWTITIDINGLVKITRTEGVYGTTIPIVVSTQQMVRIEPDQRSNMYIGRSNWSGDGAFDGKIDNFFIYNYAMTQPQVESFMLQTLRWQDNFFSRKLDADVGRHWEIGEILSGAPNHAGASETLNGTSAADVIFPNGGIDAANGYGGDDIFMSELVIPGRTDYNGGSGSDTVVYQTVTSTALFCADLQNPGNNSSESAGDTYFDVENLTWLGSQRSDLRGNGVGNVLTGGGGNDLLRGRGGGDTLKGGGGALDLADYSDGTQPVRANLLTPSINLNEAAGDTYDDIHGLIGTAFGDILVGDNRSDGLYVNGAFDFEIGAISNYIDGGNGDDTLFGAGGVDVIFDGGGNDTIYGDRLSPTYGSVALAGHANDVIRVTSGNNTVYADGGDDLIFQNGTVVSDRNILMGEDGNDVIAVMATGTGSLDTYAGGAGFDLLHYGFTEATAGSALVDLANSGSRAGMAVNDSIQDIEGLRGSRAANSFSGDGLRNLLVGGGGQDFLYGRGGDDVLVAGELSGLTQKELIQVASGIRTMRETYIVQYHDFLPGFGAIYGNTTFVAGDSGGGSVFGEAGSDTLIVSRNATFDGGQDDDTFYLFDPTQATVNGNAGIDTLILPIARGRNSNGLSVAFDYTIDLASPASNVVGVSTFAVSNIENVVGGDGIDTLRGSSLTNELTGGSGGDKLYGRSGLDRLFGEAGDDTLDGGEGADALTGGAGSDTYYVDSNGDEVYEAQGAGTDIVRASASYVLTSGQAVEKLLTLNSSATAPINLTGNEFVQVLGGNAGANTLDGGGSGDMLYGYGGDDVYFVDQKGDFVFETVDNGKDLVRASASYVLREGQEVETLSTVSNASTMAIDLTGNGFGQTLIGNAVANTLDGKGGADWLYGFGGDDTYFVGDPGDIVIEAAGGGNDRVRASGTFSLTGNQEVEMLSTMSTTSAGAIDLTGSGFGQSILGNAGTNKLDGKGGRDTLYGYGGADSFAFSSTIGPDHRDYIGDFSRTDDTILLSKTIFTVLGLGQLTQSAFKDLKAPGAVLDDDDRILYDRDNGLLSYDRDGVGRTYAAVQFAVVTTKLANLDHTDFSVYMP